MSDTKLIVGIVLNFFFPGLGNIICGQVKIGSVLLLASFILTTFYFSPIVSLFFPKDSMAIVYLITLVVCGIAWIIDMGLMILSIILLVKHRKGLVNDLLVMDQ